MRSTCSPSANRCGASSTDSRARHVPPVAALIALFIAYALVVTLLMRRALGTSEPAARLREARRLLVAVSLGVPLLAALILVAI